MFSRKPCTDSVQILPSSVRTSDSECYLSLYLCDGSDSSGSGRSEQLWPQRASKTGTALHGWLCYSLSLDIGRKNCTEASACLGLNQLCYKYLCLVPLLPSLWAVSLCSPEHQNSGTVDSYRS